MLAAIDRGNTYCKVALFQNGLVADLGLSLTDDQAILWLRERSPSQAILCNVRGESTAFWEQLQKICPTLLLSHRTQVPLKNSYKTPATLGMDRLAAACGAAKLFPGKTNLVADLGTCITFEVVTKEGAYLGGAISPGLQMRFGAMNAFTAGLPRVSYAPVDGLIGESTETSMRSGVIHGIAFEIEGWRQKIAQMDLTNINLVLTGGDASIFESKIKAPLFVRPQLVLEGLHSILSAHVS